MFKKGDKVRVNEQGRKSLVHIKDMGFFDDSHEVTSVECGGVWIRIMGWPCQWTSNYFSLAEPSVVTEVKTKVVVESLTLKLTGEQATLLRDLMKGTTIKQPLQAVLDSLVDAKLS